jgi:hypothetical protein
MKKTISVLIITLAFTILASAQFPKIPKIEKPKLPTVDTNKSTNNQQNSSNEKPSEAKNDSVQQKLPSATILKPSLTVRAVRDLNY